MILSMDNSEESTKNMIINKFNKVVVLNIDIQKSIVFI